MNLVDYTNHADNLNEAAHHILDTFEKFTAGEIESDTALVVLATINATQQGIAAKILLDAHKEQAEKDAEEYITNMFGDLASQVKDAVSGLAGAYSAAGQAGEEPGQTV